MTGVLTLSGIDPDSTPLDRWLAAVWAALIQCPAGGDALAKAYEPINVVSTHHGAANRDTWGLEPSHLAGQEKLLHGPGA